MTWFRSTVPFILQNYDDDGNVHDCYIVINKSNNDNNSNDNDNNSNNDK